MLLKILTLSNRSFGGEPDIRAINKYKTNSLNMLFSEINKSINKFYKLYVEIHT